MQQTLEEGLVSVVSPCYNVGKYLPKFLNSLLQQTYHKLHVVLVNDGSTDDTLEVIRQYVPFLMERGYSVDVVDQENRGLAGAIQAGVKYIKGEFFTWPDPDDWLYPESIQRRVEILQRSDHDVGLLRCNAEMFREDDGKIIGSFLPSSDRLIIKEDFFCDLLFRRTFFAPLCSMLKTERLLDVNPEMSIYVQHDAGQNWQLLLPVTRAFKTLQSHAVMGGYLVRETSHSRNQKTYEQRIAYESMCDTVVSQTLQRIQLEGSRWQRDAHAYSLVAKMRIAILCGKLAEAKAFVRELKTLGGKARMLANVYSLCLSFGRRPDVVNPQSRLNFMFHQLGVVFLPGI